MSKLTRFSGLLFATALAAQGPVCTFTPFGRPCGGDLAGQQIRTPTGNAAVQFDVTNAAPGSAAILVLGQLLGTPVTLPGSNCSLLVNPRATSFVQVDRLGEASFALRLPVAARGLAIEVQVVTLALNRNGRTAESTNGIHLSCN